MSILVDIENKCNICDCELNESNWSEGKIKKGWYLCNPCHTNKYRRYRKNNPFKARLSYFNKRYTGNLKEDDLNEIWNKQDMKCGICGDEMSLTDTFCLDHIIPRSKGGLTEHTNIQILCEKCNVGKHDFTTKEYIEHCQKVIDNIKNKENEL